MAIAQGGYVKAFRKILQSPHFENDTERGWFLVMLTKAAWQETTARTSTGERITIKPGQVARAVRKLADDFGIPHTSFQRFIQRLRDAGVITLESGSSGGSSGGSSPSVVTISNWKAFQSHNGNGGSSVGSSVGSSYKSLRKKKDSKNSPSLRSGESSSRAKFEDFWAIYPRKKAKGDAERAWRKLVEAGADTDKILIGLGHWLEAPEQKRVARDGIQFFPYPATWLNRRQFEDEDAQPPAKRAPKRAGPQRDASGNEYV